MLAAVRATWKVKLKSFQFYPKFVIKLFKSHPKNIKKSLQTYSNCVIPSPNDGKFSAPGVLLARKEAAS